MFEEEALDLKLNEELFHTSIRTAVLLQDFELDVELFPSVIGLSVFHSTNQQFVVVSFFLF